MTNKEAQITINAIKFMLDHAQYSDDVEEALNVAVNVLTAQPSSSCAHENDQDLQQTCNKLATDCISRQAAMDFVGSMEMCDEISAEAYQKLMNYLEELPSAQPERKTGKWNFIGDNMFECTSCGVVYTTNQLNGLRNYDTDPYAPKFCPNCGADMRGDTYE